MYARVVMSRTQPGKLEEFVAAFEDKLIDNARGDPGFRGLYLMSEPEGDEVVAVALYDSLADLQAATLRFQQRAATIGGFLAAPPSARPFEVRVSV